MNNLFRKYFLNEFAESYCTGVFSDELDKLGHRHQIISGWKMNNPRLRMFGRVRTLSIETILTSDERISKGLGFLVGLDEGDVLLVKGSHEFAYFGELMSRLSIRSKLAGVVVDGLTRDTYCTQQIDLPIFAKGYTSVDIKGRGCIGEVDVPVVVDGVEVLPGDFIFGDNDSIALIPQSVFEEALPRFNDAVREEETTKKMILDGTTIKDILEIVKEF